MSMTSGSWSVSPCSRAAVEWLASASGPARSSAPHTRTSKPSSPVNVAYTPGCSSLPAAGTNPMPDLTDVQPMPRSWRRLTLPRTAHPPGRPAQRACPRVRARCFVAPIREWLPHLGADPSLVVHKGRRPRRRESPVTTATAGSPTTAPGAHARRPKPPVNPIRRRQAPRDSPAARRSPRDGPVEHHIRESTITRATAHSPSNDQRLDETPSLTPAAPPPCTPQRRRAAVVHSASTHPQLSRRSAALHGHRQADHHAPGA